MRTLTRNLIEGFSQKFILTEVARKLEHIFLELAVPIAVFQLF
jgi:hypothetical protein